MLEAVFAAVRSACSPLVWSRGVELCRADAVLGESSGNAEAVFRVATRGGMISPKVTLFVSDAEWECECASREPVCEHVAAVVIAWRRSQEQGQPLPVPREAAGRVGYRFTRVNGGLAFERVIRGEDGREQPLLTTLAAVAAQKVAGPRFVASQADLAVELALGTHRRGLLPAPLTAKLFRVLSRCPDVLLDGRAVSVSNEPVLPLAVVEEQENGFRLSVMRDPAISELFPNGMALCGDVLRPLGEERLTGRERNELPHGRFFGPEHAAELITEVLPSLGRRLPLDLRTRRLPQTVVQAPRVLLELARQGEELSVLPTLVYGDPPIARIDAGRLVHLGGPLPIRDERAEGRLLRRLARELGLAPGVRQQVSGEAAVAFNSRLKGWDGEIKGRGREYFEVAPPIVPRVEVQGKGLAVFFESEDPRPGPARARRTADPAAVLRAWREGASLVSLGAGGFAPLPLDWLARHGQRVADLLAALDEAGCVPQCSLLELGRLCEDLDLPPPPDLEGLRRLIDGPPEQAPLELPADLRTELRAYQRHGVGWLVRLRQAGLGALLADDMGLGKTLQALCAVNGRTLVVCPTSVLHNWAQETARHRPGLRCAVYHGSRRQLDPQADLTLTTYAILRLDAERLAQERWRAVVLDEAQNIKNPASQVAAAACRLQADWRLTLTGTPVENRLDELWSQFHFLNRGLLGGRSDFQQRYAEPIADGKSEAAERLRQRIRPFVLRRLKKEVAAELPPRTDMVLRCELNAGEREVYDAIRAATREDLVRRLGAGGSVLAALEALLRLRQACCHAALVPGQQAAGSSKLDLLLETLDSVIAEGHRALVFSQWTSLLDLIEPHLVAAGLPFLRLDGSTRDRAGVVQRFQAEDGPPLLLVSLKAGGTGLNLTAADHIFLLDPWWNPAVEEQAADRAHRIGQERPVMFYRLVAADTVEERILLLQERKRELAQAALAGTASAAALGRDELLELLS